MVWGWTVELVWAWLEFGRPPSEDGIEALGMSAWTGSAVISGASLEVVGVSVLVGGGVPKSRDWGVLGEAVCVPV